MEDRILKEDIHCTSAQIAKLFGVKTRSIQMFNADGIIETENAKGGKRYNLEDTVKKYVNYLSDKAHGRTATKSEEDLREQKLKAEIRLKESQGELHSLKTEIAAGKYISVEDVKLDYSRFFVSFRNFAMSIPTKVSGELNGAVSPEEVRRIESRLNEEMSKILREVVINAEKGRGEEKAGKE